MTFWSFEMIDWNSGSLAYFPIAAGLDMHSWSAAITFGFCIACMSSGSDMIA